LAVGHFASCILWKAGENLYLTMTSPDGSNNGHCKALCS